METLIIDTDVLIDFLRQNAEAVRNIKELREKYNLGTTDINAFELYKGAYKSRHHEKEIASVKGLLNTLVLVGTTKDSMEIAAHTLVDMEKKGKSIDIRDLFISSICLTNSFKLLTNNVKHFENIKGLQITFVSQRYTFQGIDGHK